MQSLAFTPFTAFVLILLLAASSEARAGTWPADTLTAPAWARKYDTFRRSEDVYIVSKGDKKGVVSVTGQAITELEYDTILPFREGMVIVGMLQRGRFKTSGKYGFINNKGKLVVPMEHDFINSYSEGLSVMTDGWCHYRYIDKEGKKVFSLWAHHAGDFEGGMAKVVLRHDSAGITQKTTDWVVKINFLDHQGKLLIPARFDSIGEYVYYGVRSVKKKGKYGFLDTTGREVLPPVLDDIDYDSSFFWGNLRRVGRGGKFGFMNTYTGRLVVPIQYEGSLPNRDSVTWLKLNGKWGYVSSSGQAVIPFGYDQVSPFTEGLARVSKEGKFGHINQLGELVTPLQYDNVLPFRQGRALVLKGDRCGFVDTQGWEVIPVVYTGAQRFFQNGQVKVSRLGIQFTLDRSGRRVDYRLSGLWKIAIAGVLISLAALTYRLFRKSKEAHQLVGAGSLD